MKGAIGREISKGRAGRAAIFTGNDDMCRHDPNWRWNRLPDLPAVGHLSSEGEADPLVGGSRR
jgi:hypothetical protein